MGHSPSDKNCLGDRSRPVPAPPQGFHQDVAEGDKQDGKEDEAIIAAVARLEVIPSAPKEKTEACAERRPKKGPQGIVA